MTRNEAAANIRACADAIIEQRTREAMGWDKGCYRDDDMERRVSILAAIQGNIKEAFNLAAIAC